MVSRPGRVPRILDRQPSPLGRVVPRRGTARERARSIAVGGHRRPGAHTQLEGGRIHTSGGRALGLRPAALRDQLWWLVGVAVLALGLLAPALLAVVASGGAITAMDVMSDAVEVTGIPWFVGGVASLNIFVWAAAAAVFLVAALGVWHTDARLAAFPATWGVLSAVVALDDRFLLHEVVLPYLGVPEEAVYLAYGVVAVVLLVGFASVLLAQPEAVILLLALVALSTSVALDVVGWDSTSRRVAEETAKMFGAVALLCFPSAIVVRRLRRMPPAAAGTNRVATD